MAKLHLENIVMQSMAPVKYASECFLDQPPWRDIMSIIRTSKWLKANIYSGIQDVQFHLDVDLLTWQCPLGRTISLHSILVSCQRNVLTFNSLPREYFKCHTCQKVLSSVGTYKNHLSEHTGNYRFSCEVCDKKFNVKLSYEEHLRSHDMVSDCNLQLCASNIETFLHSTEEEIHLSHLRSRFHSQCNIFDS